MKDDARTRREAEIAAAAYALIEAKGFSGASMLMIAKKARASNETLYKWYGDKLGLFEALIERNSREVLDVLDARAKVQVAPLVQLEEISECLLEMLMSERAIVLNRAAAADPSGSLGAALAKSGRDTIAPVIGAVIDAARRNGDLAFGDLSEALNTYVSLLVGDLQIRRATGAIGQLTQAQIQDRAQRSFAQFVQLYSATNRKD